MLSSLPGIEGRLVDEVESSNADVVCAAGGSAAEFADRRVAAWLDDAADLLPEGFRGGQ